MKTLRQSLQEKKRQLIIENFKKMGIDVDLKAKTTSSKEEYYTCVGNNKKELIIR
ncbi:hypothetical protein IJ22_40550 [Paenibacillus naphthalenovorans]|uniref:Uncharacterized protein n=1 Tax=Paenibacillus naphthalenovorans TaxID=162209 RepID=A0A0U2WA98_9BACL|nr:hypothetical protein IJ22_40550 [Paenibacillus naphthalenovorans]